MGFGRMSEFPRGKRYRVYTQSQRDHGRHAKKQLSSTYHKARITEGSFNVSSSPNS